MFEVIIMGTTIGSMNSTILTAFGFETYGRGTTGSNPLLSHLDDE